MGFCPAVVLQPAGAGSEGLKPQELLIEQAVKAPMVGAGGPGLDQGWIAGSYNGLHRRPGQVALLKKGSKSATWRLCQCV